MPLRFAQRLEQSRRPAGLGALVDQGERRAGQRRLPLRLSFKAVVLGGAAEDRRAVCSGERLGVGHSIEQLDRALQQRGGLAVGVHTLRGVSGADQGAQRRRQVARRRVVMRDRGRDVNAQSVALGACLERPRESQIDRRALAREEIRVDDFTQQRVTEAVPALVADRQDVIDDRFAKRIVHGPALEADRVDQELVVELLSDGHDPQDLLRRWGQAFDPQHQRVAQRRRQ